jgi:hypothetical protein
MVFKLSATWDQPTGSTADLNRGFPAPGTDEQTTGPARPSPRRSPWVPFRPTKGARTWSDPAGQVDSARGFPAPIAPAQARPAGSMPNVPPVTGRHVDVETVPFSRGALRWVPNFGKVLYNPIGAGVVALYRPQAFYGPAGQFAANAIWWAPQSIPTSVRLTGLNTPAELAALLGTTNVQAVVRTTG